MFRSWKRFLNIMENSTQKLFRSLGNMNDSYFTPILITVLEIGFHNVTAMCVERIAELLICKFSYNFNIYFYNIIVCFIQQ